MPYKMSTAPKDVPLKIGRWAVLGLLLGGIITLIMQLPAQWCMPLLENVFQQKLLFTQVQGTLWQGSTQITISAGEGSKTYATLPSSFSWELSPTLNGATIQIHSACCLSSSWQIDILLSGGHVDIHVSDTQLKVPTQFLTGMGPPWSTLNLGGTLSLSFSAFSATLSSQGLTPHGTVSVTASDVNSALSTLSPLGSYTLTFKSPGLDPITPETNKGLASVEMTVHTIEGLLNIEGSGQWTPKGLTFKGFAKTTPEYTNALSNLLNIMGKRDGSTTLITIG